MTPRKLENYRSEVRQKLTEEFGYRNVHQVPVLTTPLSVISGT